MKAKHLTLGVLVLVVTVAIWLARPFRGATTPQETKEVNFERRQSTVPGQNSPADLSPAPYPDSGSGVDNPSRPRHVPEPPVPNRRFTDFTPEQRVQFARQGHGPGG